MAVATVLRGDGSLVGGERRAPGPCHGTEATFATAVTPAVRPLPRYVDLRPAIPGSRRFAALTQASVTVPASMPERWLHQAADTTDIP
jgi:hypothetical protein